LDISISCSGWGSGDRWCFDLLWYHGLQININFLVLEDTEIALGRDSCLMHSRWAKDTYRGVLDRKFLVLLKGFSEGMQAVGDKFL